MPQTFVYVNVKTYWKNQLICKKWTNNISLPDLSGYLCLYSSCLYAEHMCSCKRLPSCWFSWLFDCLFIWSIVTMPKCVYCQENGPSDHIHPCNSFPDQPDLGRCNPGYISPSRVNLSRVNFLGTSCQGTSCQGTSCQDTSCQGTSCQGTPCQGTSCQRTSKDLIRVHLIWSCPHSSQSFHTWHCTMGLTIALRISIITKRLGSCSYLIQIFWIHKEKLLEYNMLFFVTTIESVLAPRPLCPCLQ